MRHKRLIVQGAIAGLLIGLVVGLAWNARPYTSRAVVRVVPAMLSDKLVPAQTHVAIDTLLPSLSHAVTSRVSLERLIHHYKLYPGELSRMPLADVIELMREAIRISSTTDRSFEVSFSYPERDVAQRVATDIVGRIIAEFGRERISMARASLQFLTESARKAGDSWEDSLKKFSAAQSAGKPLDRVKLDMEIARQRYQNLKERVAEAEMLEELEKRQQGQSLEIRDPAELPEESRPSAFLLAAFGCVGGALLGWLISMAIASRRREAIAEAV